MGVTYSRGLELVPGTTADAGLASGASRVLTLTLTTDAQGKIAFAVVDPAETPQGAEIGGKLALATQSAPAGGTLTGNPNESAAGTAAFGSTAGSATPTLKGSSAGRKDKLVVDGPEALAGEQVTLFKKVGRKLVKLKTVTLDTKGDATVKVADKNGKKATAYVVEVVPSQRVTGGTSKKAKVR